MFNNKLYKILLRFAPEFVNNKVISLLKQKKTLQINFINDKYIYKNINDGYKLLYKESELDQKNNSFINFNFNLEGFNNENLIELHSFNWLQNLKIIDTQIASERIFELIDSWINIYGDNIKDSIAFNQNVLASRIFNWLTTIRITQVKDNNFTNKVMKSLSFQIRFFLKVYTLRKNYEHILQNKSLFVIGKALQSSKIENIALENILLFLKNNVLADGAIDGKAPSEVLDILMHLLFVYRNITSESISNKKEFRSLLDRIVIFIKTIRYKDGGLAIFNGGYEEDRDKIDFLLSIGRIDAKPFDKLTQSGYLFLNSANKINILVKTYSIADEKARREHNNSILSQEILINSKRIFVNNSLNMNLLKNKLLRSDHSTMLFFDKNHRLINMPKKITKQDCSFSSTVDNMWNKMSFTYEGLQQSHGVIWHKTLSLGKKDACLLGEELLTLGSREKLITKAILKFILHPSVNIKEKSKDKKRIYLEVNNEDWIFNSSNTINIGNELYRGIKGYYSPTISFNIPVSLKDKSIEWFLVPYNFLNTKVKPFIIQDKF